MPTRRKESTMATLKEVAKHVRSKMAGPFWLSIDIFCDTIDAYNKIKNSESLNSRTIAKLFGVKEEDVKTFYIENILALKFSFPRPKIQGHKDENDMHAGQQYIRLLDFNV
jgi:hypothetical protein